MIYISIPNWTGKRGFQHYKDRNPPWIKVYTELLSNDDYLELTGDQRAILHGLWLEYARSTCRLPADTRSLTRRLNLRVTSAQLKRLENAGFIDLVASKLQAEGYADARASRARGETETDKSKASLSGRLSRPPGPQAAVEGWTPNDDDAETEQDRLANLERVAELSSVIGKEVG